MSKNLLPVRHPTSDFFLANILDATPKDDQSSMEHPLFSLSTSPDLEIRYYEHNGCSVTITPSVLGHATIWDKDILIFCIGQLMAGINQGRTPSQVVRVTAHDMLVSINRATGGTDYKRMVAALRRLQGTNITTNIKTDRVRVEEGFGIIDRWKVVEKSPIDERMVAIEIKLSDWLYNAVLGKEVLTLNRDYFRVRGGLERRLYQIARKHCGWQSEWVIGIELLYKKSGAKSPLKTFRHQLKKIIDSDSLLDYHIRLDGGQVIFSLRQVETEEDQLDLFEDQDSH